MAELVFGGFLILLFAPIEMYMVNIDELWFNMYDFIGYSLAFFAIYIAIAYVANRLLKDKKCWMWIKHVVFLVSISLYIQGNYIVVDYGLFNGKPIEWENYRGSGIVSICLFVGIIIGGVFLLKMAKMEKISKVTQVISYCMILLMMFTLIVVCISKNGLNRKDDYVVTNSNLWNYSAEENFTIILLDGFDSNIMNEYLENGDTTGSLFKDFTYYPDTANLESNTDISIPQIITGEPYLNQCTYGEYREAAYNNSPLLNGLKESGYSLNIYTDINIAQGEAAQKVDNWQRVKMGISSHKRLLKYVYKMVGFRYLPQFLKQTCWFYTDDMEDLKELHYEGNEDAQIDAYTWANDQLHWDKEQMDTSSDRPVFHFIHLKGLHIPRYMTYDYEVVEEASLEETVRMNIRAVNEYLDKCKEEGIYDCSTIIVMADHGSTGSYNNTPLLMVKPKNTSGELIIDNRPVSYADLQTGFANLIANENLDNIFEINDMNRVRMYYRADWVGHRLISDDYANTFQEYKIIGNVHNESNVIATENTY